MAETERKFKISSEKLIPMGFLLLILLGTLLLWLPVSSAEGKQTGFLTALFTSTTSVCVTGLVVVDTFSQWSAFGQAVILFLIQCGGLGIIAVASAVMLALKKKFSLRGRLLIRDAFNLNTGSGLVNFLLRVIRGTFIVEGCGALLYLIAFVPAYGFGKGIWISVFTSISAFCNAGLDVMGPNSLAGFADSPLVLIVTMLLIVGGGLGYVVWFDVSASFKDTVKNRRPFGRFFKNFSEHTKLVFLMTAILIAAGTGLILLLEWNNPETIGNMPAGEKILNGLFQSVTFRTAGFSTFPQEGLTTGSGILGLILMFIGGSPVGTAGGVKTVTVALLFLNVWSFIKDRKETIAFRRGVGESLIRKAMAIVSVSFFVTILFSVILAVTNGLNAMDALFEVTSATATVGLSRAVTQGLNTFGRILIILAMFFGRIGPISMALFFSAGNPSDNKIRHAEGSFFVG